MDFSASNSKVSPELVQDAANAGDTIDISSDAMVDPEFPDLFLYARPDQEQFKIPLTPWMSNACDFGTEPTAPSNTQYGYNAIPTAIFDTDFPFSAAEIQMLEPAGLFASTPPAEVDLVETTPKARSPRGPIQYVCAECQAVFDRSGDLEDHAIKLKHQSYTCDVSGCSSTFPRRDTRRRHLKSHGSGKVHRCEDCGKFFARKDKLRDHVKLHVKGMPSAQRDVR